MEEALNLFDEICNSKWFKQTSMILFLNKRDLFEKKISQGIPISAYFKDYNGGADNVEKSTLHIRTAFENKNRSPEREIYTHVTTATNTSNIAHVFGAVKDIIIKESLRLGGLM